MYCEKAERNCAYLDVAYDLKDDVTVWRATAQDKTDEYVYGKVEDAFSEVIGKNINDCSNDYCALLGLAVITATESEVEEVLRKDGIERDV